MKKKFEMVFTETARGFGRWDFIDRYNEKCSLQDSSLATEDAIWLGINRVDITEKNLVEEGGVKYAMGRMHLTREQVKELIPILQHFVDHGSLPSWNPKKI